MALPLIPGSLPANQLDTAINDTRGYIEDGPTHWDSGVKVPLTQGGTNATTAAAARTNLDVPSNADLTTGLAGKAPAGYIPASLANGGATFGWNGSDRWNSSAGFGAAGLIEAVSNIITSASFYSPNATGAISGYTVGYIDGTGRWCRGVSSARYKDNIEPIDPLELGDIFPQLHAYVNKGDPDETIRYGWIAERLDESAQQRPFVVYARDHLIGDGELSTDDDGQPIPDSIDFIALLIAQNAQLHARLKALEDVAG